MTLTYGDANHVHAVTSVSNQSTVNSYQYDQNGNQTTRTIGQDTFNLLYDAENRLVEVTKNGATIAQFVYDGDGKRVKSVINGETTLFVGNYFEQKGSQVTKYYFAGAARIAMRKYVIPQNMTVEYTLGDHLGSTSLTTDTNGAKVSEMRYKPWGEVRYVWTNAPANTSPAYELVKYQFTGEYSYDVEFGLMFYNARWYDPTLGRFAQADTIVPGGAQGLDRYAYVNNNPVRYNDPTGHIACDEIDANGRCYTEEDITNGVKEAESNQGCSDPIYCEDGKPKTPGGGLEDIVQKDDDVSQLPDLSTDRQQESDPEMCADNPDGCMIAGALLIIFTDLFVGSPLAAVIILTGGVTPPAIAAEALETFVVLPINILGIALIAKGAEAKDRVR